MRPWRQRRKSAEFDVVLISLHAFTAAPLLERSRRLTISVGSVCLRAPRQVLEGPGGAAAFDEAWAGEAAPAAAEADLQAAYADTEAAQQQQVRRTTV